MFFRCVDSIYGNNNNKRGEKIFLLNFFEIIGTIAFVISGALIGSEKKLDLFGIIF